MVSKKLTISRIIVEGFRGINERKEILLNGKSLLLFGGMGKGKTSILRAVEWCLFDKLPFITGEETRFEDPIVNDFHSKGKCIVELTLTDHDGNIIEVKRERTKKESISGKSVISMSINGKPVDKRRVEEELYQILGMDITDFCSRVFLHQEAISNLVKDTPERTSVMNIILGLNELETLIKNLPTDKEMQKSIEELEEELRKEENNIKKIEQLLEGQKNKLKNLENYLIGKGFSSSTINLETVASSFENCISKLRQLANILEVKLETLSKDFTTLEVAEKSINELTSQLRFIQRKKDDLLNYVRNQIIKCNDYLNKLKAGLSLEFQDLTQLKAHIKEVNENISNLDRKLEDIRGLKRQILEIKITLEQILKREIELNERIVELQKLVDEQRLKELKEEINKLMQEKQNLGSLSQIWIESLKYIKATRENKCPTCDRPIDLTVLIESLEEKIRKLAEARRLQIIDEEMSKLSKELEKGETLLKEIERLKNALDENKNVLEQQRVKLINLGFAPTEPLKEFIAETLERLDREESQINNEVVQLKIKLQELSKYESMIEEYMHVEQEVQRLLNINVRGEELCTFLNEYISKLEEKRMIIESTTSKIDELQDSISIIGNMIEYLAINQQIKRQEEILLPPVRQKLAMLQRELERGRVNCAALHDIREATLQEYESRVKCVQEYLGEDLSYYYQKLVTHPQYSKLSVVPEAFKDKYVYRLKAETEDGSRVTYILPKFSHSEINAVALSVFLTLALKSPLGFIIMDDPSQSMDAEKKEILSEIIKEVADKLQVLVATQDIEFQNHLQQRISKDKAIILSL